MGNLEVLEVCYILHPRYLRLSYSPRIIWLYSFKSAIPGNSVSYSDGQNDISCRKYDSLQYNDHNYAYNRKRYEYLLYKDRSSGCDRCKNICYTMIIVVSVLGNKGKKETIILFKYINRNYFSRIIYNKLRIYFKIVQFNLNKREKYHLIH